MREPGVDVAGVEVSTEHFIGGERVASDATFTDLSPIDAQPLAEVARGGEREAELAVAAAAEAFPGWAALGATGRAAHLHRLADLIDANVDRLAAVECADMAMLLRSLRARVINRGARNFRAYADLAVAYEERVWESNGTRNRVIRMPSGPAVVITPWNAPFMLSTWKTAPALAAGLHGDPQARRVVAALVLAPLRPRRRGGVPARRLQRRAGDRRGDRRCADAPSGRTAHLVHRLAGDGGAHRHCRRAQRRAVHRRARREGAAARLRRRRPRGGRAQGRGPVRRRRPGLPRRDAAARRGVRRRRRSSSCSTGITDEHVLGDPRDDATTVSPLIHPDHLARVEGFVERARANGDEIVRGGRRREDVGPLFYDPTLVVPRSNDSEIVQREVFGPVLTFQTFADEDEGVALANSTRYGLSGIVYTGSEERATRVGRAVRAGTVWVNTFLVRDLTAPFGGIGISGIGREGGDYALDFYSDLKTLQILEGTTA